MQQNVYHLSLLMQPTPTWIFPSSVSHLTSKAKTLRKPSQRVNSPKEKQQLGKT